MYVSTDGPHTHRAVPLVILANRIQRRRELKPNRARHCYLGR